MRALLEQARQDMRAGEQVIAYPGEVSHVREERTGRTFREERTG
jgi:hypothetical protein